MECPYKSKYMGKETRAQIPLSLSQEFIEAAVYHLEKIDKQSGYQAAHKYHAAQRWIKGIENNEKIWLGISGAATPVGLGGLIADMIDYGLIDAIVSTGANVYHDLHLACGLPVRHGSSHVDDKDLWKDETTRIYTQFIHNRYTLKAQDLINQKVMRTILSEKKLQQPFSTAMMLHEFGKALSQSEYAVDKKSSFVIQAAEHGVPIFLDSGSNHSLGMDFSLLQLDGLPADSSPSRDIHQAAALSLYNQPQLNIFLGEGGPRNFTQTTAPTAAEIFSIPFEGSEGCIRFTTADERNGALSGSTKSEAISWGKYKDDLEIVVWGEYTLTAPDVMAYVAGKTGKRNHSRLMDKIFDYENRFLDDVKKHRKKLLQSQQDIAEKIPLIQRHELEVRNNA